MAKKKKRLQMQSKSDYRLVSEALADGVALGITELTGYDAQGEPVYRIAPNAEARLKILKKVFPDR